MIRRVVPVTAVAAGLSLVASGAFASFGGSVSSAAADWSTLTVNPATGVSAVASCGPPLSLTAKVVLSWTASTSPRITDYTIRRRIPPAAASDVTTVGNGVSTYTDNGLLPATTYGYVVRAKVGSFYADAAEVQVTTPTICL